MTSALGDNYREPVLDALLGVSAIGTVPDPCYASLWTTVPATDGTGGTEVANANAYGRVSVANDASNWAAAAANLKGNAAAITFPTATGAWGTVAGLVLTTSGTYGGGSIYLIGTLVVPKTISSGEAPSFAPGDCHWSIGA